MEQYKILAVNEITSNGLNISKSDLAKSLNFLKLNSSMKLVQDFSIVEELLTPITISCSLSKAIEMFTTHKHWIYMINRGTSEIIIPYKNLIKLNFDKENALRSENISYNNKNGIITYIKPFDILRFNHKTFNLDINELTAINFPLQELVNDEILELIVYRIKQKYLED